jgi:hypothetical protein
VRVIRNEKQKDNLAKFSWDMAKVSLAAPVIAPIAKPDGMGAVRVVTGVLATAAFGLLGYMIDGRKVQK